METLTIQELSEILLNYDGKSTMPKIIEESSDINENPESINRALENSQVANQVKLIIFKGFQQ
jgi:hypothetical protein